MGLSDQIDALATRIATEFKNTKKLLTSRLTASVANSNTTYAATGLVVTLIAGKTYRIRAGGHYQSAAATTGMGLRIGGTASATSIRYNSFVYGVTATTVSVRSPNAFNGSPTASTGVAVAANDYPWSIEGIIVVNAGGQLGVDFSSEVAATAVTISADSFLEAQEIA